MKRKASEQPHRLFSVVKQLRSKLPRRPRSQFSPILRSNSVVSQSFGELSSHLTTSFSCDSSRASSVNKQNQLNCVTRAYSKKKKAENEVSVELSEFSCVESSSGAVFVKASGNRASNLKSAEVEVDNSSKKSREIENFDTSSVERFSGENLKIIEASENVAKYEISSVSKFNGSSFAENDVISLNSVKLCKENEGIEVESAVVGLQDSTVVSEFDLVCSEHFSIDDDVVLEDLSQSCSYTSSYSSAHSEMQEMFLEWNSSEYTPSIWYDSGSQFSENSYSNACPSLTFQLFRQFSQQFCRSTTAMESTFTKNSSLKLTEDYFPDDIILLGLEDEEHEESYRMIRSRERRQVYLHDYAAEYCSSTSCGDLIIQQRLQMVHWIVEQSSMKEFQKETMFLGVNLLDRLLSKGYFTTKRNLQIAGIACLTLATRIEENQPYNSVRQKTFHVENTEYSRSEVVAMEWLVQEVLKFKCFLPTIYNFLWFYLKAVKANEKVEKTIKYLAVLVLLGHEQLCYWPSTVAASLVIIATRGANQRAINCPIEEIHATQNDDHLSECIKSLEWLVNYIS